MAQRTAGCTLVFVARSAWPRLAEATSAPSCGLGLRRDIATDQQQSHQHQQPPGYMDDQDVRAQLLERSMSHVKQHGWTHAALVAGARDMNLSPAATGIFPRREGELVEHLIRTCNTQLSSELKAREDELAQLPGIKERLAMALRLRLEMLHPHIDSWPQALSVASRPANLPHSLSLLASLVDEVWHVAGNSATDSSWYTQRMLLAGVYTCTELYMLTDYSPGFQDTWQALDRRLADMLALSRASRDTVRQASKDMQGVADGMMDALTSLQTDGAVKGRQQNPGHQQQ